MNKFDLDTAVGDVIGTTFDPPFMGTRQFLEETEAIFFEKVSHILVAPVI
jgi:hypothetical protein